MSDALLIRPCTWRGLGATLLRGERVEVVVSSIGAQVVCLRQIGDALNPLWQPPWPSCRPEFAGSEHGGLAERALLAVIAGSNLCLDRFGFPWPGESKPLHGEAGIREWQCPASAAATESVTAALWTTWLPMARLHVARRVALHGETLILSTTVRHDGVGERVVEWAEHTTLGDPFLAGATISAGVDRVFAAPSPSEPEQRFCVPPLADVPVADALRMPLPNAPACGDILSARVVAGWWQAEHPTLNRRLRVSFDPCDFPWLTLWTEHRSRTQAPWHGVTRARGMELSTKPFPEGQPPQERATRFAERPTECRVPPSGRTHTVRFQWTRLG